MNTQTAKEIAENRHNIIVKFIEEFFERMVKINYKIIKKVIIAFCKISIKNSELYRE